ncbi:MAG: SseB family protein [Arachnia sp.]
MHSHRLIQPSGRFAGDQGAPDPLVREILGKAADPAGYVRAIVALCTTRLILPVVASGEQTPHRDPQRAAQVSAVTLTQHGVTHLIGFTGIDAMLAWRADARPVLCLLDELCASVEPARASALLIDPAGPTPLVIEGDALAQLAAGYRLVEFEAEGFAWVKDAESIRGNG